MNKIIGQYKNGNYYVTMLSDGTKIRRTEEDEFIPLYPENTDCRLTANCSVGCNFCYDGATPDGKHGNLNCEFLNHLHPYTEMALNGNDLNHPDLIPFLEKLKSQKVFANITLNQIQFEKNIDTVRDLVDKKLVWGVGISLVNPSDDFIALVKEFPNAVIHTINGLLSEEQIDKLANNDLKILVLGYKMRGRGDSFYEEHKSLVESRKAWLDEHLGEVTKKFKVMSFDNLAIEQLTSIKSVVGDKWDEFYMGDDGGYTFYIDLVNGTFAKNSCIDERFPIGDKSMDEMFNFIREKYGK